MNAQLHIKNMVCPRCITAVERVFSTLNIPIEHIILGKVELKIGLEEVKKQNLSLALKSEGFELLEDQQTQLISQIKSILIHSIHHEKDAPKVNYSSLLSEKLKMEYTTLSKLFSSELGITIERFIRKQKIEKVKEYLFYNQFSLSEVAFRMHYSSAAHLSSQFKQETGMTPTAFKKIQKPGHQPLDSI